MSFKFDIAPAGCDTCKARLVMTVLGPVVVLATIVRCAAIICEVLTEGAPPANRNAWALALTAMTKKNRSSARLISFGDWDQGVCRHRRVGLERCSCHSLR